MDILQEIKAGGRMTASIEGDGGQRPDNEPAAGPGSPGRGVHFIEGACKQAFGIFEVCSKACSTDTGHGENHP